MRSYLLIFTVVSLFFAGTSMAMKGMDHGTKSKDHKTEDGSFTHTAMSGDIHAEFQIMDLASMNMKDPDGRTHHVMVTFTRNGEKISDIVGKVKVVSPGKKEQLADLKDYGGGIYAANFTFDDPGKWGVISVFKDQEGQHTVKFWYPHMDM